MPVARLIKVIRKLQLIQLEVLDFNLEAEIDALVLQLHQVLAELTAKKVVS